MSRATRETVHSAIQRRNRLVEMLETFHSNCQKEDEPHYAADLEALLSAFYKADMPSPSGEFVLSLKLGVRS